MKTERTSNVSCKAIRIGADVGGTFTDVVVVDGQGNLSSQKVLSTPPHFEGAVIAAIRDWLGASGIAGRHVKEVAHGTTVATNAVLERRGAKTALITTKGFRDVLELRRIRVPVLYDWFFEKPKELVERYLRFEVDERILANGEVQVHLQESELWALKEKLEKEAVESVAICFLHAYAYPEHEMLVGRFLRKHLPHLTVSLSSKYEVGASLSTGSRLMGGSGELIRAPSLDIAEVGAGGGSIAYLDRAGGFHVGPRSAGAVPGPACYRQGGSEPTVTDANVVLGYIRPGPLANGEVQVDPEAARRAIQDKIAGPLGINVFEAAEGIHRIANTRIMKALREVSTERGRDPREFILMAFGGSGPVHAAGLAAELSVQRVLVPPLPGLFSALGLLFSNVEHHGVRSCLLTTEALFPGEIERLRGTLRNEILAWFKQEGYSADRVRLGYSVDMRSRGQTSGIRIPLPAKPLTAQAVSALREAFEDEHERLYGHRSDAENTVEVLAVRLVGEAMRDQTEGFLQPLDLKGETTPSRMAYFGSRWGAIDTPVVARASLHGGTTGPLLIDEYDSTVVVPPATRVWLDDRQNIVMEGFGSHQ